MTEYTIKCENCGNDYDNYERTFYIEEKGVKKCVCQDCLKNLRKGKLWFRNHIPDYCVGFDLVTIVFDSVEQLTEYVNSQTDKDYIATFGDSYFDIVDVNKNRRKWWVRGYVSHEIDLPDFYETIEKLGYIGE